jgi:hypothetical protein
VKRVWGLYCWLWNELWEDKTSLFSWSISTNWVAYAWCCGWVDEFVIWQDDVVKIGPWCDEENELNDCCCSFWGVEKTNVGGCCAGVEDPRRLKAS